MKVQLLGAILLIGCSAPSKKPIEIEEVSLGVEQVEDYPKLLSDWNLFESPMKALNPSEEVMSYDINSPLFSDYAFKKRFIRLPEGKIIKYDSVEVLNFLVGTILIKNFYYPTDYNQPEGNKRILETRLLIHEEKEWKAIVYEWNEGQTDANRLILGNEIPIEWKDNQGNLQRINYSIPSQPQCKSCHDFNGDLKPIGPTARQLNKDDQLQSWMEKGKLERIENDLPKLVSYTNENELLNLRARAWLEVNCAHCHRREGPAKNSGLYLLASQNDAYKIGVNKSPVAAGRGSGGLKYGIVPGNPDQSILVHRIESLELGEMMPELGRKMVHQEGVELVRKWIEEME
jgi:uncharacterized repeat protein (TIGR03806 family)